MRLSVGLSEAIRQTAQADESTPFMLLLAAFQTLLYRYSGQRDIRIGVPNANRPRQETQGLIGFFINTLVLRAELDGRLPFNRAIGRHPRDRTGCPSPSGPALRATAGSLPSGPRAGLVPGHVQPPATRPQRLAPPAGHARR